MRPQARHADADADTRQTNVKLDDGPPEVGAVIITLEIGHRFANDKIYGNTHVAMTDDLIVDINKDTRKVKSFNPTDKQYKNLLALLLERGDLGSCVNQNDMFFLISTLQDIIRVQVMKTDFHD